MKQPWARAAQANSPSVRIALQYRFEAEYIPSGPLYLALELPATFTIRLNGRELSADNDGGWWVNPSLRRLPVEPTDLRLGENLLELTCDYNEDHAGLEIVYLLGNFGVCVKGTETSLTAPVRQVKIGNLVEQGLPFYSGSVVYSRELTIARQRAGERLFLQFPEYQGVAVRVTINQREAGIAAWPPHQVEITDFCDSRAPVLLQIELLGHRRNSHGPLHLNDPHPHWTGPGEFISQGDRWRDDYSLVPYGLTAAPQLLVKEP